MAKKTTKSLHQKKMEGITKEHHDGVSNFNVFQIPDGERKAGYWTFTINGQETLFYSSNSEGIYRTIRRLMTGPINGSIRLRAMKEKAEGKLGGGKASQEAAPPEARSWEDHPTTEERIKAFLTRGKLNKSHPEHKTFMKSREESFVEPKFTIRD